MGHPADELDALLRASFDNFVVIRREPDHTIYAAFNLGEVVTCPGDGVRGLTLDVDLSCEPGWRKIFTDRGVALDQPFYTLLAETTDGVGFQGYYAQSQLEPDASRQPLLRAPVKDYVRQFVDGHYQCDRTFNG